MEFGKKRNTEIDCTPNKKTGELLCKIERDGRKAVVLGQASSKDGVFRPLRRKGDMDLIKELEEYMISQVDVVPKDDFG